MRTLGLVFFAAFFCSLTTSVSCLNTTYSSVSVPAPTGSMSFTLLSPITGSAPFTLGFAFVKGHITSGQGVASSNLAEMQVVPKNYWSDGSLKYAVISGHAALTADTPLVITLGPSTVSNISPLTLSDLKATGITATINCESYGSVSWQTADWDSPHLEWTSGWQMSNWIYRKPVGNDPHLVAWLDVRLYKGGVVEVLPWIENGYIRVPNPTNKTANFRFDLGGNTLFNNFIDLPTHTRTPLLVGTALSYWFGATDPAVTVHHDTIYMQASLLVPSYFANSDAGQYALGRIVRSYAPLQQGNFDFDNDQMPSPGYQRPIGLLPEHDVVYLTSVNATIAYKGVVFNGYSAGRYPLHWRDEHTLKPLRFSDYPNLVIDDTCRYYNNGGSSKYDFTPRCNGTLAPRWDTAHSPSVGYMAYLVTGRWFFMEQVQFAATTNFLGLADGAIVRNFSTGLLHPVLGAVQTRSSAWMIRALAHALSVTPDSDDYRNNFKASWESNIWFHHEKYIQQANNDFGLIQPGEGYDNGNGSATSVVAIWQQDFVTAAWGHAISLDLPVSDADNTKAMEFFQWKCKAAIGRLGPSNSYWYINGAPYTITVSTVNFPDYLTGAGPWLADWSAIYAATFAKPPTWLSTQEGVLSAEFDIGSWPKSMWGNIQPAISFAVQLRVPGAVDAYFRMVNATNWPELKQNFNPHPVWSVTPAKIVSVPAPVSSPPYTATTPRTSSAPSRSPSTPGVSTATSIFGYHLLSTLVAALVSFLILN